MKTRLIVFSLLISAVLFSSCGKDSAEKQTSDQINEKKETATQEKNNSTKEVANKTADDLKLYTVEKVEKSSGKKISPNVIWNEDGKQVSISDMKGKVVLLNFWATWCGPCVREMPDLSKISEELKDKDFKMIGMNVFQQEGSKKVNDFLKTNPVSYTILDGNQEVVDAFGLADGKNIEAVPTTFIIDKNGKIVETIIGGRNKEAFLSVINKYLN
ncbi:MAG TPA: TlpA disulfide reductase family protein [Ignavibacteria bacterium]|nr:TlpA disulfide reductase family protein [Ignavibacteria bacterium]